MPITIPDFVPAELERLELPLEPAVLDQLAAYLDLLLEANKRMNLTAVRDVEQAWRRHIIDSLTVLPGLGECQPGEKVADVGTGGGLPGMVLAIARPDLSFTLIDATGKKTRFLEDTASTLGLEHVKVIQARAETLGQDSAHRAIYDIAVCRALGKLNLLLEYLLPLVKVGGAALAMKGPSVEEELREAGDALEILGGAEVEVYDAYPEGFDIRTLIIRIEKHQATPRQYPRLPGAAKQSPL